MYGVQRSTPVRSGASGAAEGERNRFLLVERPAIPWTHAIDDWSPSDRAEYERARRRAETVVLLDAATGETSVRAPAVLRESLLSIWGESPEDEEVRRELGRLTESGAGRQPTGTAA